MSGQKIIFRILFVFSLLGMGCNSDGNKSNTPKEYDLSRPETFNMPESLKEISGIAFNKGKGNVVYTVQDEEGKVFRLNWQNQKHNQTKFSGKGDYEDITLVREQVVILESNGSLFTFPVSEAQFVETGKSMEWKNLLPKGEYESIFGDEATGKIYVLCKACSVDNPEKKVSGYILSVGNTIEKTGNVSLNVDEIKALGVKVKRGFQPSALAKNPVSGDWYILSSLNKTLIVVDKNWKSKLAYPLSSNNFNQPEGIAFDQSGNLYISNEGDDMKDGNILKFKRLTK
ncbi:SdiA-regulated domain-containing protein [Dyadobacter sp. CY345]|uniref:SdiA-regulated domain-containing protein n=1 Tax=Dyadobacter sp. CY345 TaxID=2909335 RepID=UPI001F4648AE|nr:SdiA-regulated domain-containing protein [Dyadobacter sp. CY345]MCF2443588.1 SdiA-regulated domain-containing protein [Dyadobacter sp. CY345]